MNQEDRPVISFSTAVPIGCSRRRNTKAVRSAGNADPPVRRPENPPHDEPLTLPGLWLRPVNFENRQTRGNVCSAPSEAVETRSQNNVLADVPAGLTKDKIPL